MIRNYRTGLIYVLIGVFLLLVATFLTLAIGQAISLISLYRVSASPPPATGISNPSRFSLMLRNDLLILAIVASALFILVFRHPRRLLPLSIMAALVSITLSLYSGRHILPHLLVWPTPVSISEQYVQALASNDLEAALQLTNQSDDCRTIMMQAFQDHQALLKQRLGDGWHASNIQDTSVKSIRTFYAKPVPNRMVIMQPVPKQFVTIRTEMENGETVWLNLKMSYNPFLGTRYICGKDFDSQMERTEFGISWEDYVPYAAQVEAIFQSISFGGGEGNDTEESQPLPHLMKGYELYSWKKDNQWHFTLMTGTNRLKSVEEVTSDENAVSDDGWVKISVIGVDGIKKVLSRLPQGEEVSWIGKKWREQTGAAPDEIALPPENIIWDVQEHCKGLGLGLQVVKAVPLR